MHFKRLLNLGETGSSAFLFGPRMTGKTTLLRELDDSVFFDLLDPETELRYRAQPRLFFEELEALPNATLVIIDEIQKIPELLNYAQMGIDRLNHTMLLSGSSARKLKRGGANLLGGRALDLKLHPLTCREIGSYFTMSNALHYGTLPKIASLILDENEHLATQHLKSYVTTYIKEEIQAEALTRNIGSFQRFLSIAAQSNSQVIEFSNISRECSVPASTVKEYYQILEDTHLGFFLWPCDRNERKKARPKFYFFDCGVTRALQNRLIDPPSGREKGFLFETWFTGELRRLNDYLGKGCELSFWRYRNHEIDILITRGSGPVMAIECKSGATDVNPATINSFQGAFPGVPLIIASLQDPRPRLIHGTEVLPWETAIGRFVNL